MTDDEIEKIAHRQASVYKHRSDPSECSYGFMRHTLIDFARAILAAHEAKKQQDHLTSDAVVCTEPGEESALGVKTPVEPDYPQRWKFPGVPVEPQPDGVGASALGACDAAQQGDKQ